MGRSCAGFSLFLFLVAFVVSLPSAFAAPPIVIFGFGDFNESPYAYVEDGQLTGGLVLELGDRLAQQLDRQATYRYIPRNRLAAELKSGGIDAYCLAAPEFYRDFSEAQFTRPIFVDNDIIVLRAGYSRPATLDGLRGALVGTVLGYHYPAAVERQFAQGQTIREDARNAAANIRKLASGRLDAIILPALAWSHALAREPGLAKAARPDPIALDSRPRSCLISPAGNVSVEAVDQAIAALQESRWLQGLTRRYGLSRLEMDSSWVAERPDTPWGP